MSKARFSRITVQIGRVALDPVRFDHNALDHAIQAVALLFIGAGELSPRADGPGRC